MLQGNNTEAKYCIFEPKTFENAWIHFFEQTNVMPLASCNLSFATQYFFEHFAFFEHAARKQDRSQLYLLSRKHSKMPGSIFFEQTNLMPLASCNLSFATQYFFDYLAFFEHAARKQDRSQIFIKPKTFKNAWIHFFEQANVIPRASCNISFSTQYFF
jgi:hypothetical protein